MIRHWGHLGVLSAVALMAAPAVGRADSIRQGGTGCNQAIVHSTISGNVDCNARDPYPFAIITTATVVQDDSPLLPGILGKVTFKNTSSVPIMISGGTVNIQIDKWIGTYQVPRMVLSVQEDRALSYNLGQNGYIFVSREDVGYGITIDYGAPNALPIRRATKKILVGIRTVNNTQLTSKGEAVFAPSTLSQDVNEISSDEVAINK